MTQIDIIRAPLCELGEAPIWDYQNQCLYWIDIVKKCIYCLDGSSQAVDSMNLPFAPSAIIPKKSGGQLLVTKKGLALMDFKKKSYTSLPTPAINFSEEVFNDGKCDSSGRLWVDTRDFHTKHPKSHLYCFESDFSMRCLVSNLVIGNGLTWSVDESNFYLADSKPGSISVFDFDVSRALGVASLERSSVLPDVPSISEIVPGFEAIGWMGLLGPSGLPLEIVSKVNLDIRQVLMTAEVQQKFRDLGATPGTINPQAFTEFVRKDTEKWRALVKSANIKAD